MKPETDAYDKVEYSGLDGKRRKHWSSALPFITGVAASILLGAIAFSIHQTISTQKTAAEIEAEEWNYCGRSSALAKERGCVMEPMFYGDANLTQPLTPHQLWNAEYNVIYTDKYHDEHCLFQWRKLAYAVNHKMEFVDNKTISIGHSKHCADEMTRTCEIANGPRANYIELGFYRCRKTIW